MTRARRTSVLGVALLPLCLTLSACTASPPLDPAAASALQHGVRQVADLAASRDYSGAERQLQVVQGGLAGAIRADQVTAARAASIQAAIDQVHSDLASLEARSATAPAPAATAAAPAAATPAASAAVAPASSTAPVPQHGAHSRNGKNEKAGNGRGGGHSGGGGHDGEGDQGD